MTSRTANSLSFEQMCNFVAVAQTRSIEETLHGLIFQCLIVFEHLHADARQFRENVQILCGVDFTEGEVQLALDTLVRDGKLIKNSSGYALATPVRAEATQRLHEAQDLERTVKEQWANQVENTAPILSTDAAWSSLRTYLAGAFRQHGLQTVAVLDPHIDTGGNNLDGLTRLLDNAVKGQFPEEQRAQAKNVLREFLSGISAHGDRARWVVQLADGVFNYYSLTTSPEVSQRLRQNLTELTLFFDTNVLFGVLNLHVHPHVEVSQRLLRAVQEHKLPFKLRYHERTKAEMQSTIEYYGDRLRGRTWSQSLSRAAANSPLISGIEARFHRMNAERGITPEVFLRPYEHFDAMLKEKGIDIYRSGELRTEERALLFAAYRDFLVKRRPEKGDDGIEHDSTLLDSVRDIRSRRQQASTLDSGALLLTSDYLLYRFDWANSRNERITPSTVLPSTFWQLLRPFLPPSEDFDRAFAETFALPEFRSIGSGAAKATSRLLEIMSSYSDLSEELSVRMLSNDMLIDRLRQETDPEKSREIVELEITAEYQALGKEKEALERQLQEQKQASAHQIEQLAQQSEKERNERENERQYQQRAWDEERRRKDEGSSAAISHVSDQVEKIKGRLDESENVRQQETEAARNERVQGERREQGLRRNLRILLGAFSLLLFSSAELLVANEPWAWLHQHADIAQAVVLSIACIAILEAFVYGKPWKWLRDHNNSYGIQGAIVLFVASAFFAWYCPTWRTALGVTTVIGILLGFIGLLLQMIGGPKKIS